MTSHSAVSPAREALPGFPAAFQANFLLAWRAVTRNRPYRVAVSAMLALGVGAPALANAFLFFVADHTRVELLASNIFLWSAGFSLLLLPTPAQRISCRGVSSMGVLAPASAAAVVLGRFAGLYAAYLGVSLLLVLLAVVGNMWLPAGTAGPLLATCFPQVALGSILVAGVFLFSQAGGALFTSACGVLLFVLATQKGALLASCGVGLMRSVLAVALVWLPDFGLFRISPEVVFPAELAGYAAVLTGLYLLLAILRVRVSWRRLRVHAHSDRG